MAEVRAGEAKARRSKTTGSLVLTMPKVDPHKVSGELAMQCDADSDRRAVRATSQQRTHRSLSITRGRAAGQGSARAASIRTDALRVVLVASCTRSSRVSTGCNTFAPAQSVSESTCRPLRIRQRSLVSAFRVEAIPNPLCNELSLCAA